MNVIDKLNQFIGNAVAWLIIPMVLGTLYNVIARYYFEEYSIQTGEAVIIMNAVVFLLAAPLLLSLDKHVRVDVFYSRFSTRGQAVVDCFGTLCFLLPLCGFLLYFSWHYVESSWKQYEASPQVGGLPGLYLVKSLIIVVAVLLFIQGLSLVTHKVRLVINPRAKHSAHRNEDMSL